jgi:S-adenosylmethionine:tRNA ribosyltransferase-isomerase
LVVDRLERSFSEHRFFNLPELLNCGDLLIVNNTKVVPARLFGRKESGGRVEILVLEHFESSIEGSNTRWCLLKVSGRPKEGGLLLFSNGVTGQIAEVAENGLVLIAFSGECSIDSLIERNGYMPLPPYIRRQEESNYHQLDRERYQTIFSANRGAIAAPTAGLHFTADLVARLGDAGIRVFPLVLHVGVGTFRPVQAKDIRNHQIGEEFYRIDDKTALAVNECKRAGGRVIACGTTVVRALETVARSGGSIEPGEGKTNLLITPGFSFRVVDALITNFHLPRSSLMFLVSAFGGLELIKKAYRLAIGKEYRFYSYGDAMLIV